MIRGDASPGEPRRTTERALSVRWWWSLPSVALLLGLVFHYLGFFEDDAYISLRYARSVLEGQGLTYNPGERVEGYTNLLWVLLTAGLGTFMPLEWAPICLGILAAASLGTGAVKRAGAIGLGGVGAAFVGSILMLAAPFGVWAVGGLEANLVALLAFVGLDAALFPKGQGVREGLRVGLACALLALTRADGCLVAGAIAVAGVVQRRARGLAALAIVAPVIGAVLGQSVFRWFYYGEILPMTALARGGFSLHHLIGGIRYVASGLKYHVSLLVLLIVGCVSSWRAADSGESRRRLVAVALVSGGSLIYVAVTGGGIFPGYRHFAAFFGLTTLPLILGVQCLVRGFGVRASGILAVLFISQFFLHRTAPLNLKAQRDGWQKKAALMGAALREAFAGEEPLLLTDAAGGLAYESRFRTVDTYGLTNATIGHSPRKRDSLVGHEKGLGRYALSLSPDLVIFNDGEGGEPWSVTGLELLAESEFVEGFYRQCFRTRGTRAWPSVEGTFFVRQQGRLVRKGDAHISAIEFVGPHACYTLEKDPRLLIPGGEEAELLLSEESAASEWELVPSDGAELVREGRRLRVRAATGAYRFSHLRKIEAL